MIDRAGIAGFATIAVIALYLSLSSARAESCDAPRPNFPTAGPAASTSRAATAFSGEWEGYWRFQIGRYRDRHSQAVCARLFISVVSTGSARVLYCVGTRADRGTKPGCARHDAEILGDTLRYTSLRGNRTQFTMTDNDTLRAEVNGEFKTLETLFHRR